MGRDREACRWTDLLSTAPSSVEDRKRRKTPKQTAVATGRKTQKRQLSGVVHPPAVTDGEADGSSSLWSTCVGGGRITMPGGRARDTLAAIIVLLTVLSCAIPPAGALDVADCRLSLGMQSGRIPDNAVTSSSSYDESVSAPNARIRTESNGGAWCPRQPVSKDTNEFLEIDLGRLRVVTMVETQGRFGNGQGQEFADQYLLEYQREKEGPWFRFHNRRGQEIFQGNMNTYIAELREIDPPMITRRLRFVPISDHPKTVCMRVEVYGCDWKDGTVSYEMMQGERRGADISLLDFTYDGTLLKDVYLNGGLGQLTDGVEGQSNFRLDPHGLGIKGYDWIGWRNETFNGNPVEIVFKFNQVRNFSSMRIHCNNMFSKDVRVFKTARLYFSVGGLYYTGEPIVFKYMRDILIEYARPVIVQLNHNVGKYVKLLLYFDARWLMVSEVVFDSGPATGNFSLEKAPLTTAAPATTPGARHIDIVVPSKNRSRIAAPDPTNNPEGSDKVEITKGKKHNDDEIIGIVIGILATLILLLFILMIAIIIRQKRGKLYNNHRPVKGVEPHSNGTLNLNELCEQSNDLNTATANGKLSNGKMYSYVANTDAETDLNNLGWRPKFGTYREPMDSIQNRKLPELPKTPESTDFSDTNTSREYAIPDMIRSSVIVNIPPPPPPPPRRPGALYGVNPSFAGPGGAPSQYYTISEAPNIQGVSGNNLYSVPNADHVLWKEDFSVMEFPRENLKFQEKLGEGQFGEVHLCEIVNMNEMIGDDFLVNRTRTGTGTLGKTSSMRVVVKTLKKNADENARFDFHREVKIMCRLKDANVVRVLGVCSRDNPLCVIVEYMKFGDLNQFLKQHVPESTMARKKSSRALSYGCCVYLATQVASGMKYLETINVVHRDLASRNCLVGHNYTIKISDFGMSRSLYSADYYRIEGRAVLPIRWMAWESVLLGKFSSKSDVWSFGVTLWEVLTFCRQQPFEELTDEQVIENCTHFFHNDSGQLYLPQPQVTPKEIYDLMRECWNTEENDRPTFKEIHMFLQRKNMGYDPKSDQKSSQHTNTQPRITVPVV